MPVKHHEGTKTWAVGLMFRVTISTKTNDTYNVVPPLDCVQLVYNYNFTRGYGSYIELVNGIINQGRTGEKRPCWDVFQSPSSIGYLQHSSSIWVWLYWLKKSKTGKSTREPFVSTTCGITATTSVLYLLSKSMSSSFFLRLSHSFWVYPQFIGDFPIETPMNWVDFPACHVSGGSPVVFFALVAKEHGELQYEHRKLLTRRWMVASSSSLRRGLGLGQEKDAFLFGFDIPAGNLKYRKLRFIVGFPLGNSDFP